MTSYANIVAHGSSPEATYPSASPAATAVEQSEPISEPSTESPAAPAAQEKKEKEKKVLAPAPVPATSAWGATLLETTDTNSTPELIVDESKWPTPDTQVDAQKTPQKFVKATTNKWLPINAKVIMQSSRPANHKQNRNRKKNPHNKNSAQRKSIGKTEGEDDESAQGDDTDGSGYSKYANGQKNYKQRYNGGSAANNSQYNKKYAHPQQQGPQGGPQNGYYHPQPFAQNPNFPAYQNSRQFKPQNRNSGVQGVPHGYNYRGNVPVGGLPTQIPPPISPKQNPQEALGQQIDYYFSLENLIRDIFLRKNMDAQGWVLLALILDFKRVKIILNGIQNSLEDPTGLERIVVEIVQQCQNLEVEYLNGKTGADATIADIKLRVKNNYEQWLLPAEN